MVTPLFSQISPPQSGTAQLTGTPGSTTGDPAAGNVTIFAALLAGQIPAPDSSGLLPAPSTATPESFLSPMGTPETLPLLNQITEAQLRSSGNARFPNAEQGGYARLLSPEDSQSNSLAETLPATLTPLTDPNLAPSPAITADQPVLMANVTALANASSRSSKLGSSTAEGMNDDEDTHTVEMYGAASAIPVHGSQTLALSQSLDQANISAEAISLEQKSPAKNNQETANLAAPTLQPPTTQGTPQIDSARGSENRLSHISTPLHEPSWKHDFGSQVVWMAKNDQQTAKIEINPPHLGPVQISLQLNGDQATAVFTSPHAEVRQVIQDGLNQLREQLASAGLNLAQADVGSQAQHRQQELFNPSTAGTRRISETAILPGIAQTAEQLNNRPLQQGRGLVDLFA